MHEDAGHYAGKHPGEEKLNERAAEALKKRSSNDRISCTAAHEAAAEAGISPSEAGKALDLLEIRIVGCQLGLFGHKGSGDHGKAELRLPANSEELKTAVKARLGENGISCVNLWEAAAETGCAKFQATAVCDEEKINIHDCQLGAF